MKIVYYVIAGWIVLAIIAALVFIQSTDLTSDVEDEPMIAEIALGNGDKAWLSVLQKVPSYYRAPKNEAENKPENKPKVPPVNILDGTLQGVVMGPEPSVIVLPAKATEPVKLSVGQSWLEPWAVQDIAADYVVWVNQKNQKTTIQYLF